MDINPTYRFKQVEVLLTSIFITIVSISFPLYASRMVVEGPLYSYKDYFWSVNGSIGYTHYENMYQNDGQSVLGRLGIAYNLIDYYSWLVDIEAGIQNGNVMRLNVPQDTLNELGGLPIQSTIKPQFDLLLTFKNPPLSVFPLFALLKGGVIYRHWQINDRTTVNDLSRFQGELQAGLGYQMNEFASLNVLYQRIFGGNPNFESDFLTGVGHLSNIPIQQSIMLGFSLNI